MWGECRRDGGVNRAGGLCAAQEGRHKRFRAKKVPYPYSTGFHDTRLFLTRRLR